MTYNFSSFPNLVKDWFKMNTSIWVVCNGERQAWTEWESREEAEVKVEELMESGIPAYRILVLEGKELEFKAFGGITVSIQK